MIYKKEEIKNAVKTLFFEGAGVVPCGDVENCRIRTAFHNDEGQAFYIEFLGVKYGGNKAPAVYAKFENAGFIDYCYQIDEDGEKLRNDIEKNSFEYSKANILEFINSKLGCSFDSIKVLDMFDGYRVHKDGKGFSFMEDFEYNEILSNARREAFNKIDMEIREKLNEKYSKISLAEIDEKSITVRCYASDKSMRDHGMNPDERFIKIPVVFDEETFFFKNAKIGDLVEQELVDDFMDILPPACMRSDCSQVGEPYSHREDPETGDWKATYATFKRVYGEVWQYCGNCFRGENVERGKDPVYI